MPTFEELRPSLVADAQSLPETINAVRSSARQLSTELSNVLEAAYLKAAGLSERAQAFMDVDTLPINFTGLVHNYRFGMAAGKPMHRFDVEVPGTGLWLACQFTSQELDSLVMTANPPMDIFEGALIEEMMVTVRRDPKLGRMVPITFGASAMAPLGPILLKDQKGLEIRSGDKVSIRKGGNSFDRTFTATVIEYDKKSDTLTIQQKGQKSNKKVPKVKSLYKFERKGSPVSQVGAPIPIGLDRKNNLIVSGDFLKLYDEFNDGRVTGIAAKLNTSDSATIDVRRVDGKVGGNDPSLWTVALARVERVNPVVIGKDAKGKELKAGDRVRLIDSGNPGYVVESRREGAQYSIARDDRDRSPDCPYWNAPVNNVEKIAA